jgi:ABC-2 type transport system ATP-binding protein
MFGLLGPNGAGKSSLMRCMATLQEPSAGEIRFGDIDVLASPRRCARPWATCRRTSVSTRACRRQDLLDHLAVLKGITGRGERRDTVETLLQQVNLWDVRKKAVAGFSGGMRQRFGIAQALIGNPQLIIVDEPTAGLDPEERNRFNNLLARSARRGGDAVDAHRRRRDRPVPAHGHPGRRPHRARRRTCAS